METGHAKKHSQVFLGSADHLWTITKVLNLFGVPKAYQDSPTKHSRAVCFESHLCSLVSHIALKLAKVMPVT